MIQEFKLIQELDPKLFNKACSEAIKEGFIFVGQLVITGLGQGQFMYTQQWAKGIEANQENELPTDKS